MNILCSNITGHFSFWSQPESHGKSTIKEFIEQCVENSRNGRFLYFIRPSGPGSPPMPIHLLHPVSRYGSSSYKLIRGIRCFSWLKKPDLFCKQCVSVGKACSSKLCLNWKNLTVERQHCCTFYLCLGLVLFGYDVIK